MNGKWSDHYVGCKQCRTVIVTQPVTFARTCAIGAPLLMAHARSLAAPDVRARAKQIEEWARSTGAFTRVRCEDERETAIRWRQVASPPWRRRGGGSRLVVTSTICGLPVDTSCSYAILRM